MDHRMDQVCWPTGASAPSRIRNQETSAPAAGMVRGLNRVGPTDDNTIVELRLPPRATFTVMLFGDTRTERSTGEPPPTRLLIKVIPVGLPHPLARSQPTVALKPLLQLNVVEVSGEVCGQTVRVERRVDKGSTSAIGRHIRTIAELLGTPGTPSSRRRLPCRNKKS
jgi:hypothetical protein